MNNLTHYTLSAVLLISTYAITAADNVIIITSKAQFDKEIIQSGRPAIVKVGTDWCGACKASEKPFHKLSNDFPAIVFASLDADKNDALASEYDVQSLPTLLYFNNGKLVSRKVGYNKEEVTRTLGGLTSAAPEKKKSLAQEPVSEQAQVSQTTKELTPEAAVLEQPKSETEAPACLAQSESFFERAYNATRDFFVNLGNTIRGWFK